MTDAERRRSRFGWPTTTEPTTTPAGTHDHRLKSTPLSMAFLGILLLFLVNVGLVGFVLLARESRDEQQRRTNERINESICDLLDQLPEGGLLDRPRAKYHCGPGMPLALLTPEERAQLANRSPAPTTTPAAAATRPLERPSTPIPTRPPGAPPRSAPPRSAPTTTSPPATTATPPTTPPGAPDPITDPLCDALGVCL